ncbi:replication protein A, subunit RPA32 [Tilletiaria anomala UBC 951]|uniref:Replication protein A, subunit RPA32 n=1 Tax=Tilletiaria anomala (strain ATCC 24038 / CBS 436.72 / UBC 951) TaxID=1037660 RepID=A0A066WH05_TILAU|nr:replication protein A, subunit RPA32 [Tilletiaria anomala UBC 951]KDN53101.1 replication protein A, subunit RPA32 [Tilletiaria anomala UBC 951]
MSYSDNPFGANYAGGGGGGGGGGFMAGSGSQGDHSGGKKIGNNSLHPVTIHQIINAQNNQHTDQGFMIDGADIDQITVVATVRGVVDGQTNVTLHLDDGTGNIDAKVWKENASDDTGMLADVRENTYVRIVGTVKSFQNKTNISAAYVRPIIDHNEWIFHKLDVIHVHLSLQRGEEGMGGGGGAAKSNASGGQRGVAEYFGGGARGAGGGGSGAGGAITGRAAELQTPIQKKVYQAMADLMDDNTDGVHVNQIAKRIGGAYRMDQVEEALQEMQQEGHVFTPMEDYWMPCE